MPEDVRYLSRALPPFRRLATDIETLEELWNECSRRFGEMYVGPEDGGGGTGSGSGVAGDAFLIPVPVTQNLTITQAYLANISVQALGNHPIAVAVYQNDDVGGHLVVFDPDEFVGADTAGLNVASRDWAVDDGPRRVTVYEFYRHPGDLKWWLASWISYPHPDYIADEEEES